MPNLISSLKSQVRTIVRYHFTSSDLAKIKKSDGTVRKNVYLYFIGVSGIILVKLCILYDPEIIFIGMYLRDMLLTF